MKRSLSLIALLIFTFSCANNEIYINISGEWNCTSWISESTGNEKCDNNVSFNFNSDKTYFSVIGNVKDSGDYRIQDDILYAMPSGKMEIAVEIDKLSNDTLILLMNQAGNKETLVLIKQ